MNDNRCFECIYFPSEMRHSIRDITCRKGNRTMPNNSTCWHFLTEPICEDCVYFGERRKRFSMFDWETEEYCKSYNIRMSGEERACDRFKFK